MRTEQSQPVLRSNYQPYPYNLKHAKLLFELHHDITHVVSELIFESKTTNTPKLVLNGENIQLISIELNNKPLSSHQYSLQENTLTLQPDSTKFTLKITTSCQPNNNTSLMGLYSSAGHIFTQCEPEGFRRITWFPDRPDVMATYKVTLRANKTRFPVLLSNGNLVSKANLDNNRHETVWHDPYPKPSYLFAVVAGNFAVNEKRAFTSSGRNVLLQVYSDHTSKNQTNWALDCLERAMLWDESRFGLELDLDRFMIVAAQDFNMGAMENKGLNVFNASYVLACENTATDKAFRTIEAVIGHEYFHNWTGNRVTCRDWFQLSLKEGLTVFREQEFSADMMAQGLDKEAALSARAVKRIDDVEILRSQQFPEDIGPMAHPIRPESYHEISNFYTATIYEKGAEIIRMLHTLLGESAFMQGMHEYFKRHDGKAVTCDDFLDAMQTAYTQQNPDQNLNIFRRWYAQAGTPNVAVLVSYNSSNQTLAITLKQSNPPVGLEAHNQTATEKPPLHIPVAIGFLGDPKTKLLELKEASATWEFTGITQTPVISILRGFSAPVNIEFKRSSQQLRALALEDSDPFARWEAVQEISAKHILSSINAGSNINQTQAIDTSIIDLWAKLISDTSLAPDYLARILSLISAKQLMLRSKPIDPVKIAQAQNRTYKQLGKQLHSSWLELYISYSTVMHEPYNPKATHAGKRALAYVALSYLVASGSESAYEIAVKQYHNANNLTDRLNALQALTLYAPESASISLLDNFFDLAKNNAQLTDHWFSLQAGANWATTDSVTKLAKHPQFSLRNPNRARSLVFQFCLNNFLGMHQNAEYNYWVEQTLALDALNPEIAARLVRGFDNWERYAQPYKNNMQLALKQVQNHENLSANVNEIVNKALGT